VVKFKSGKILNSSLKKIDLVKSAELTLRSFPNAKAGFSAFLCAIWVRPRPGRSQVSGSHGHVPDPAGFREFYPEDFARRIISFASGARPRTRSAFAEYDAPVLEPLETLQGEVETKSKAQLFSFTDKGGREVALRPEMTRRFVVSSGARERAQASGSSGSASRNFIVRARPKGPPSGILSIQRGHFRRSWHRS